MIIVKRTVKHVEDASGIGGVGILNVDTRIGLSFKFDICIWYAFVTLYLLSVYFGP
jgi:hypothetical protein